jgi:hypothetical protein
MDAEEKRKAICQLLLHGNSVASCGLFWGKSGIALALFHQGARQSLQPLTDYATYLIGQVAVSVSRNAPLGLEAGLAGIGWTFDFIARHHYLDIDTAEACYEIDQRIMDFNPSRITDLSLETGWAGLLTYMVSHIGVNRDRQPFERDYLLQVQEVVEARFSPEDRPPAAEAFLQYMSGRSYDLRMDASQFVRPAAHTDMFNLSLRTGIAGQLIVE